MKAKTGKSQRSLNSFMEMASNPPEPLPLIANAQYEVKLLQSDVKNITNCGNYITGQMEIKGGHASEESV